MAPRDLRVERAQTADGSWTLRDVDRDLSFRSIHGASTESEHVFVMPSGIADAHEGASWRVFELGFGGALNFHRTRLAATSRGVRLDYVALERAPVRADQIFHDAPTNELVRGALEHGVAQTNGVRLEVIVADWQERPQIDGEFDAVYHDPFGPRDNPDAWTAACFRWSRALVRDDGRLLTYSVAGHVRRALADAGWHVRKRTGPPGKREVLVAVPR